MKKVLQSENFDAQFFQVSKSNHPTAFPTPHFYKETIMSQDAVKEVQRSLNIIRNATNKENYATKVKVLELMTQAILSQVQALDITSLGKNVKKPRNGKKGMATHSSQRKSLKPPPSTNNPNDKVATLSQSVTDSFGYRN